MYCPLGDRDPTEWMLWTQGDAMEMVVTMWHRYTQWVRHERRIQGRHRRCRNAWDKKMEEAICLAKKNKYNRRVWKLTRTLGGTGRRERKRNAKDLRADDPTPTEWSTAMSQKEGDGGYEATEVCRVPEGTGHGRKEVLRTDAGGTHRPEEMLKNPKTVLEVIQKMR